MLLVAACDCGIARTLRVCRTNKQTEHCLPVTLIIVTFLHVPESSLISRKRKIRKRQSSYNRKCLNSFAIWTLCVRRRIVPKAGNGAELAMSVRQIVAVCNVCSCMLRSLWYYKVVRRSCLTESLVWVWHLSNVTFIARRTLCKRQICYRNSINFSAHLPSVLTASIKTSKKYLHTRGRSAAPNILRKSPKNLINCSC